MGFVQQAREKLKPWILIPIFFGMCAAIQQAILGRVFLDVAAVDKNGEALEFDCKSCGFFGATVTLSGGLILSLLICPSPVAKLYSEPNTNRAPFKWWMCFGPVLLMCVHVLVIMGYPSAGGVLTTILFNVSSVGTFLVFDNFGFMSIPKRRVTLLQMLVVLLFLGSALVASLASFLNPNSEDGVGSFKIETLFPFFAGSVLAFFVSFNISSSMALPYMTQTSLLNYSIALPLGLCLWGAFYGGFGETYTKSLPWFGYTPGIIDMLMIMACFLVSPKVGSALYQQFFIAGQLICSLVLDNFHILKEPTIMEGGYLAMSLIGVFLTLVGALISVFFTADAEKPSSNGDVEKNSDVPSTAEPDMESEKQ